MFQASFAEHSHNTCCFSCTTAFSETELIFPRNSSAFVVILFVRIFRTIFEEWGIILIVLKSPHSVAFALFSCNRYMVNAVAMDSRVQKLPRIRGGPQTAVDFNGNPRIFYSGPLFPGAAIPRGRHSQHPLPQDNQQQQPPVAKEF